MESFEIVVDDPFIKECPYCHGKHFFEIRPNPNKIMLGNQDMRIRSFVYVVCEKCQSIVRTYLINESVNDIITKKKEEKI